jgi:hypothetical protein
MSRSGFSVMSFGSLLALGGAIGGCAGGFDPAHFEGSREARRAEPEALVELATRSSEIEALGSVHASCTLRPGFRSLNGEALSDVDCSTERLVFALRESAASAGGEVLVGLRCNSRRGSASASETRRVTCSAEVARFSAGAVASRRPLAVPRSLPIGEPAPSASEVKRIDEPDAALAFRITLDFEPGVQKFERPPRARGEVSELNLMPLADHPLGDLQARCTEGCDERALRRSVLIAAARLGAPDVVALRCFDLGAGNSCVGTLAAPEREE